MEREWHKGPVRESGLQTLLKQLHQLLTLIHGPIESLLEKVGGIAMISYQGQDLSAKLETKICSDDRYKSDRSQ